METNPLEPKSSKGKLPRKSEAEILEEQRESGRANIQGKKAIGHLITKRSTGVRQAFGKLKENASRKSQLGKILERYREEGAKIRNQFEDSQNQAREWLFEKYKSRGETQMSQFDAALLKNPQRLVQQWRKETKPQSEQRPWDSFFTVKANTNDKTEWASENMIAAERWATANPGLAYAEGLEHYIRDEELLRRELGEIIDEPPEPERTPQQSPQPSFFVPNFSSGNDSMDDLDLSRLEDEKAKDKLDSGDEDEEDAIEENRKRAKADRRAKNLMRDIRSGDLYHVLADIGLKNIALPHLLQVRKTIALEAKNPMLYLGHINYKKMKDPGVRVMTERLLGAAHVNDQFINALRAAQYTLTPNLYLKHRTELLTKIHERAAQHVYEYMVNLRKATNEDGFGPLYDDNRVFTLGAQRMNDILTEQLAKVDASYPLQR